MMTSNTKEYSWNTPFSCDVCDSQKDIFEGKPS